MKEIGGYIELEFKEGQSFHSSAIALNTARNCFEYVLRAKKIKKILIPHFICDVMLEPINKFGVIFQYYHIDSNLEPIITNETSQNNALLYTNYFGIKNNVIKKLHKKFGNLIIDNSQAFYHYPVHNVDTFYSARKFFGVPDGAYLYTDKFIPWNKIEQDFSFNRISHLIKRIEMGANAAYPDFLENDKMLYNQPIRKMSEFSRVILGSIDYKTSKAIRERNFLYLHDNLFNTNEFKIDLTNFSGPMFYPFLFSGGKIRQGLLEKRIYVPTLWKNVFNTTKKVDFEQYLVNNLFPLPVDQRYDITDMEYIISALKSFL
jgi:hypothetical protein